ncbi:NAD-dependent deacetylase [candidate division CSSED10-310 bacterium]|uniref:protein acetyllysine N-acetyltransferase n=1 Tax=candidate division CSSED10-310 bacterium TaxID=2855610 RepID=A0ABV6YW13_UNCC1
MLWRKKDQGQSESDQVKEIVKLIEKADKVVAFTGAGVSTGSGIPDFRSPSSGLWTRYDPNMFTADYFRANPAKFYEMGINILPSVLDAKPNVTHNLLAKLEQLNLIAGIITQNIDGLHQRAGSKTVFELHGNLRQARCLECGQYTEMEKVRQKLLQKQNPPLCEKCQGILKIDAVLFGDPMPPDFMEAVRYSQDVDLFLVLGSSLTVYPANLIPERAGQGLAKMVIINKDSTLYDRQADIVINNDLLEISQQIMAVIPE